MKNKQKTRNMAFFAMFLAIELILTLTPLGYIRIPGLAITLLHIPVVVCGILMGPGWGAALGLCLWSDIHLERDHAALDYFLCLSRRLLR